MNTKLDTKITIFIGSALIGASIGGIIAGVEAYGVQLATGILVGVLALWITRDKKQG